MSILNNGGNLSAGVYDAISDESIIAQLSETCVCAFVGPSHRGKVGEPVLFNGLIDFRNKFGRIDSKLTAAHICVEKFLEQGSTGYFTRVARNAKYGSSLVGIENNFAITKEPYQGYADPEDYNFGSSDLIFLTGRDPGNWNNGYNWVMYPDTDDQDNEAFYLEIFERGKTVALEIHRCTLRDKMDGNRRQMNVEDVLENANSVVRARVNRDNPMYVADPSRRLVNAVIEGSLMHGDDGDEITIDDIIDGWNTYDDPEEFRVDLLINGGYADPAVQMAMLEMASLRGDCHAILDMPRDMQDDVSKAVNYRRNVLNASTYDGSIYAPYSVLLSDEGTEYECPPSGHFAERAAFSENVSHRWFAVAGVNRAIINAERLTRVYNPGERGVLDQNQINFIQNLPGYGPTIMSQLTLQPFRSSMQDQNVVRLVRMLNRNCKDAAMVTLFEPGDSVTWTTLRNIANSLLAPAKQKRGLYGYEVICDERNNKPETIASGDTILDIYIDPTIATKRIFINAIVAPTGGVEATVSLIDRI
jgi:hypothetical protein